MARTPRWKVYSADNEYLASCKYIEDAARLMDSGMTIRDRHSAIVWREGSEAFSASESYDDVADTVRHRCPKSTLAANKRGAESMTTKVKICASKAGSIGAKYNILREYDAQGWSRDEIIADAIRQAYDDGLEHVLVVTRLPLDE